MKRFFNVLILILSLMISICAVTVASFALDTSKTLADTETVWKYLDNNTDPAENLGALTDWTLADFDDSEWNSAAGTFGSKGGSLGAVSGCATPTVLLNLYIDGTTQTIPTYFFRTTFEIEDISSVDTLLFDIMADDAIVVYLNGNVICDSRSRIPEAALSTNMYYAEYTSAAQSFWLNSSEISAYANEGENTLAVELHNNQSASSDIYFGLNSLTATDMEKSEFFEDVVLCVGADETERQIVWQSTDNRNGSVTLVKADEIVNGIFPDSRRSFDTVCTAAQNSPGYYVHKAVITGLEENTEYVYQLTSGTQTSGIYHFKTGSFDSFNFAFVGDPQISTEAHGEAWRDTLQKINMYFDARILISAGDQIVTPSSEEHYSYFFADELTSASLAATIGPVHDDPSTAFSEHFALPNASTEYGVTVSGSNYWYTYGNVLFMHLNMADAGAATNGEHKAFLQQAMDQNRSATWKIVILHNALFSAGMHSWEEYAYFENEIGLYREKLAPVLTELGVDIVLSGHDHIYVRSKMMDGNVPSCDEVVNNTVTEPYGTLHICASSSTGSKFYDSYVEEADYIGYKNDEKRKSAINFSVKDGEIKMTSYFLDDMSVFDEFTIYKTPHVHTVEHEAAIAPNCYNTGRAEYWFCDQCGSVFADEACTVQTTMGALIIDATGHKFLDATCTEPKRCSNDGCTRTIGNPIGHEWGKATCTQGAVCEVCGEGDENPLGHEFDGDCDAHCNREFCDYTRTASEHTDADGDGNCDYCNETTKGNGGMPFVIIGIAAAVSITAAAVAAVIIKRRTKK